VALVTVDLQRCIAVPKATSEKAKHIIRRACVQCGIIDNTYSKNLTFCSDTEATAMYTRHFHKNIFTSVQVLTFLDVGAGNMSLSTFQVQEDAMSGYASLFEIDSMPAEGHKVGSLNVDDNFFVYLELKLGYDVITKMKSEDGSLRQRVQQEWLKIKKRFDGSSDDLKNENLEQLLIPNEIPISHSNPRELAQFIYNAHTEKELPLSGFQIDAFFNPIWEQILDILKLRLKQAEKEGHKTNKLILSGGFLESDYVL
jgi:hypothetical protein